MRHELHLTRRGLQAAAVALIPLAAIGIFVDGATGAASIASAAGVVLVNHGLAALSTGWSRTLEPRVVAVGYGGFVVRMFAVFAALAVLATADWMHRGLFAAGFCATLVVTLGAEVLSYVRRTYVPSWRLGVR